MNRNKDTAIMDKRENRRFKIRKVREEPVPRAQWRRQEGRFGTSKQLKWRVVVDDR